MNDPSRRSFLKKAGMLIGSTLIGNLLAENLDAENFFPKKVPISGHLWVYASAYPPNWDCTPVLEKVFSDFSYAGMDGLEVMEVNLRHDDAVTHLSALIKKYKVPVTGTSYGADMWNRDKHPAILADTELVIGRLHQLGGSTMGISVGNAGHVKTNAELDAQADLLRKIRKICQANNVVPNLHNHIYEVENNLHDLRGTLSRIPDFKLGPDLNWLVRAGVDPVWFISRYGHQMVYMHLRDQKANGKWTEALGEGVTDFPAIAAELKKMHFKGRAAIELAFDTPPVRPLKEDWKISREYVRRVFGW
ncbi:MAG TPA: TIM barrel protein [Chitinophagaceae bacterium]|nr:TIM barrel protein [Chitinophagaceae bacterium]